MDGSVKDLVCREYSIISASDKSLGRRVGKLLSRGQVG